MDYSKESNRRRSTESSVKFLCSYGGKILPRQNDGKLRYIGGHTRVLSVHRSISFADLMVKMGELCGYSVSLRCQLPNGDMETLVSIKSDEDLVNIIEEYERFSSLKIRAIMWPLKSVKAVSPRTETFAMTKADFGHPCHVFAQTIKNLGHGSNGFYGRSCHVQGKPLFLYHAYRCNHCC